MSEDRHIDREQDRQLWRDTQRQINELSARVNDLTLKIADTNDAITRMAEESRAAHEQFRVADQKLAVRIDSLVADNVIQNKRLGPGLTKVPNQSDIE